MTTAVLVAGIGNVFLGDDGFGPAVARHLVERGDLPDQVRVVDYGVRGLHLAYDLLDGVAALVLVDALPGDDPPGTVTVLEVGPSDVPVAGVDAHAMDPATVLATLRRLGGTLPPTYVVGCRPATLDEGMGLHPAVAAAVPEAVAAVDVLLGKLTTGGS
ncbi:hydrogenase maturation protease [Asanoa sp. WMMD1127]|uniref:hydrogenase maturation protease n=1 Tax=Asanoa sp. WMMD1127 TaxID=3016107 RepID=UPI00241731B7|nr:hydrogenase maturation protease [Asanoa sp. WMMD1127]MDG4826331.1 hydrogenase maturation protease [Asanoa sp. WMMD1127]